MLFFDLVSQFKLPAGLSSVDVASCYDSVAHAIAVLTFRAFGVPKEAVQVVLKTIEKMNYFLRTVYGDSKDSEAVRSGLNSRDCVKEMVLP